MRHPFFQTRMKTRNLVRPERMVIPFYKNGSLSKMSANIALLVYDALAGVSKKERRILLNTKETLDKEPTLNSNNLQGAGLYYEYRTDDSRLTISLLSTASSLGANIFNYCSVIDLIKQNGVISGVKLKNTLSDENVVVSAKHVINATGVWVDDILKLDSEEPVSHKPIICYSKGIHLVFPFEKLPIQQSLYFDAVDNRMIFCIPRDGFTYVGTTDISYPNAVHNPEVSESEISYILESINSKFDNIRVTETDIVSSWCGLRHLINKPGKSFSELSRNDEIFQSPSGLITIAGGKLTGFRLMAEKIMNIGDDRSNKKKNCSTKNYQLLGSKFASEEELLNEKIKFIQFADNLKIDSKLSTIWFMRYGMHSYKVLSIYESLRNVSEELRFVIAELDYCIEYEWVKFLDDFIQRRTSYLYFDSINIMDNHIMELNDYLSKKLNYSEEFKMKSLNNTLSVIKRYRQIKAAHKGLVH